MRYVEKNTHGPLRAVLDALLITLVRAVGGAVESDLNRLSHRLPARGFAALPAPPQIVLDLVKTRVRIVRLRSHPVSEGATQRFQLRLRRAFRYGMASSGLSELEFLRG